MSQSSRPSGTDKNQSNTPSPLFATDYHIYINHTDAGGIVYHANHLTFFENVRRDWFTQLGLNTYFLQTDDDQVQHFVVSSADLQYKQAILLDEKVNVRIDKVELKPASIIFYQSIHRHLPNQSSSNQSLLSQAKIVIACVQNDVKPKNPELARETDNDSNNNSDVVASAPSAAPIRPVRVPKVLKERIEAAINQQQSG